MTSKHKFFIILTCIVLASCGALKKTIQLKNLKTATEFISDSSWDSSFRYTQAYSFIDSTQVGFKIYIEPEGLINISLKDGFNGFAKRVILLGAEKTEKKTNYTANFDESRRAEVFMKQSAKKEVSSEKKEKEKKKFSLLNTIFLMIALFVLIKAYKFCRSRPA